MFAIVLFVVLVVENCAADGVPLFSDQVNALRELYAAIGCAGDALNCPNVTTVCPDLELEQYGERLACTSGYVTAITITGDNTSTAGSLPTTIGRLSMLTSLLIYNTYFKTRIRGVLPDSLFDLTHLVALELCCGALTGTLSPSFARLTALRELGLHDNQFSGTIPSVLSQMASLKMLRVDNNMFTGVAPAFPSIDNASVKCSLSVDVNNKTDSNCFSSCEQPTCCRSSRPLCPLDPPTTVERTTASASTIITITIQIPADENSSTTVSQDLTNSTPLVADTIFSKSSGSDTDTALIAIASSVIGVALAIVAVVVVYRWRRRSRVVLSPLAPATPSSGKTDTYGVIPPPQALPSHYVDNVFVASARSPYGELTAQEAAVA